MPDRFSVDLNLLALSVSRVKLEASLIGGMRETQEVVHFCADNRIRPQVQVISAAEVSDAWVKVQQKEARYRYVIDASTF